MKEEEKLAEEFALSSFPGFIFRAPSAKLPGISFVPFSSDNAALAACAKGWLTRKLAFSPPGESGGAGGGEGRGEGGREVRQRNPRRAFCCSCTVVMPVRPNYQTPRIICTHIIIHVCTC